MRVRHLATARPATPDTFADRWQGPDQGVIYSWLRGIEKAAEDPALAERARAGELPVMGFKGGVAKPLKNSSVKIGSLLYLAQWIGLRGEDLDIDTSGEVTLTCSRTGVAVLFTLDTARLLATGDTSDEDS